MVDDAQVSHKVSEPVGARANIDHDRPLQRQRSGHVPGPTGTDTDSRTHEGSVPGTGDQTSSLSDDEDTRWTLIDGSGHRDEENSNSPGSWQPRLGSVEIDSKGILTDEQKELVTPFNFEQWKRFLAGCPNHALKSRVLVGLKRGVDVQLSGPRISRPEVRNLQSAIENAAAVVKDIEADVKLGRRCGPFDQSPLDHFIASPLGVVKKAGSDKVRVSHDSSYPFGGKSVNKYIPPLECVLTSFDHATRLVVEHGRGCLMSKIDVQAAYRCIPIRPSDWGLVAFKWEDKYYFDKVLPFGLGSSCAIWEDFGNALEWIIKSVALITAIIHYIDDCFLVSKPKLEFAKQQLELILMIYKIL